MNELIKDEYNNGSFTTWSNFQNNSVINFPQVIGNDYFRLHLYANDTSGKTSNFTSKRYNIVEVSKAVSNVSVGAVSANAS